MIRSKFISIKLVGIAGVSALTYQQTIGKKVKNAIRDSGIFNNNGVIVDKLNNSISTSEVLAITQSSSSSSSSLTTSTSTTIATTNDNKNDIDYNNKTQNNDLFNKDSNQDEINNIDNNNSLNSLNNLNNIIINHDNQLENISMINKDSEHFYFSDYAHEAYNHDLIILNTEEENENSIKLSREIEDNDKLRNKVKSITGNHELMSSLIRQQVSSLNEEKIEIICEVVSKCFEDDEVMSVIRRKIQNFPVGSTLPSSTPTSLEPIPLTPEQLSDEWAKLIGSHKCCMCLDLLAAPCITNCGHSFCGDCITTHINRCVTLESGIDVVIQCPMCRHEISGEPTFERVLDEDIANQVKNFPDCLEKRDWSFRRETFKAKLMLKIDKKSNKKSKDFSQFDDQDMDMIQAVAVVVVMCIILSAAGTVFTNIHKR